jgi:hypothetical protein
MKAEAAEEGRSLMMRKALVKPEKEVREPVPEEQFVQNCLQDQRQSMQGDNRQWEH